MPAETKRDQVIDTALRLFNARGFNATGIDSIIAEAGVAKMTLYKHFKSKDELIEAALRRRDERFRDELMAFVEQHADTPRDRLLVLFDAYKEWFSRDTFRGCMFLNAAAEFSQITDSIRAIAREHKRLITIYVRGLAAAAGAGNPEQLADQLVLLLDGAISNAQVCLDPKWADRAKEAAAVLLEAELNQADRCLRPAKT